MSDTGRGSKSVYVFVGMPSASDLRCGAFRETVCKSNNPYLQVAQEGPRDVAASQVECLNLSAERAPPAAKLAAGKTTS